MLIIVGDIYTFRGKIELPKQSTVQRSMLTALQSNGETNIVFREFVDTLLCFSLLHNVQTWLIWDAVRLQWKVSELSLMESYVIPFWKITSSLYFLCKPAPSHPTQLGAKQTNFPRFMNFVFASNINKAKPLVCPRNVANSSYNPFFVNSQSFGSAHYTLSTHPRGMQVVQ